MVQQTGLLIAFEGIDGTGKTTLLSHIKQRLEALGLIVVAFKEPTNETVAGKNLRESYSKGRVSPEEELIWFMDDRTWNVQTRILPALAEEKIVLLDRYFYSTACYQGARLNNNWENILAENRARFPKPDLTVILDLPPEISLQRLSKDRRTLSSFEELQTLQTVRSLFLEIIRKNSIGNFLLLDSSRPLAELQELIFTEITKKIVK